MGDLNNRPTGQQSRQGDNNAVLAALRCMPPEVNGSVRFCNRWHVQGLILDGLPARLRVAIRSTRREATRIAAVIRQAADRGQHV